MTDTPLPPPRNEDSLAGFGFALGAYLLWGFLPLYMKALAHIPPVEIIAHRALWSLPVAGVVLIVSRRTADLKRALQTPRMIGMAAVTAALISVNWGIYIWAIVNDHALDAALGYYINPLFSILLGAVLLGERPSGLQKAAIALAALAVVVLTVQLGKLPVVAIALMLTWGAYAYLKKQLPIGPNQGFFLEVLMLTPPALIWLGWLAYSGQGHFLVGTPLDTGLLLGCGLVTAVPLILYANGAKRLRLSTIGIMQYIAPTMIFLTAVFVFGEPFGLAQATGFAMIWGALVLYSVSMFKRRAG
ncbi:EamA family transporter RarD [Frigidibacter albus]|uniref:EamA family transporter RarD n=1 Tax=Frigidibacter albus TaxID=1465486 RepID=A0A6L8VEK0_9RHOB|nr:EamA family transporter RarD [Frigidibacter albus]MZQ88171.1 EamA family transporter RarD [Frigidibacter albus]NBE30155.1 EamA family transporter RarD [Frigidibacter albus]GGH47061.1 permease [Frigidibacter albus]